MSFIGSLLSNSKGAGFQAQGAPLQTPATTGQANTAYDQTQEGIKQQQAFLQALQAQGGIGNQQNVFNQQQATAGQLQNIANGQGPNPAAAALNQATGANTANQASLMAGQRGAAVNPGLVARMAANVGAANQQNAVGQTATLEAQQQLAGINALTGQQANLANTAAQQVGQQANATQNYNAAAQGQQQNLLNSINQQNANQVGMQSNINNANAGVAGINAKNQANMLNGIIGGAGTATEAVFADGGQVGPKSKIGQHLKNPMNAGGTVPAMVSPGEKYLSPKEAEKVASGKESPSKAGKIIPGKAKVKGDSLENDTVPAKLKEGGIVIPRSVMQSKDPEKGAAAFVRAHMSKKQGLGSKKKNG